MDSQDLKQNDYTSFELYHKAAEQGDAEAQYRLGCMFYEGEADDIELDSEKAFAWFLKAAEQGHAQAQFYLGEMYALGEVDDVDSKDASAASACAWYSKAAAQGHTAAQRCLGYHYYQGKGVTKSLAQAMEWFQIAADLGDNEALQQLASIYYYGCARYVNKAEVAPEPAKAIALLSKAAAQGNAYAQNCLGNLYRSGEAVTQNLRMAMELYQKAAAQDYAPAQANLGVMYHALYSQGEGAHNFEQAKTWFLKAAHLGHGGAMFWLTDVYHAAEWRKPARKQGVNRVYSYYAQSFESLLRTSEDWPKYIEYNGGNGKLL